VPEKPEPPYSPEVDLKGYPYTPIYRARLFGSSFHARANDAQWRAGVTLWLKSQDQVPAGSLPNDDVDLCRLAELGRDLKTWKKLKQGALRGWYECSDGLLYHPVVAEIVQEQWRDKLRRKWLTDCARAKKYCQRHGQRFEPPDFEEWLSQGQRCDVPGTQGQCPEDEPSMSQGQTPNVPGKTAPIEGNRIEGKGRDSDSEDPNGSSGAGAPQPTPTPDRDPVKELWDRGIAQLGNSSRSLIGKARRDYGDLVVMAAIMACEETAPSQPVEFFLKCLETRNNRGNGKQSPVAKLFAGALLAAEEWERRQGNSGNHIETTVALLDRRRSNGSS
jgi:hypothetical protein